jgi:hypothetical protein
MLKMKNSLCAECEDYEYDNYVLYCYCTECVKCGETINANNKKYFLVCNDCWEEIKKSNSRNMKYTSISKIIVEEENEMHSMW